MKDTILNKNLQCMLKVYCIIRFGNTFSVYSTWEIGTNKAILLVMLK
jgi:hypothetical protein